MGLALTQTFQHWLIVKRVKPLPFPYLPLIHGIPPFPCPIPFPLCPPLVPILYPARRSDKRCELPNRIQAASLAAKRILVQRRPKLGMALG